MLPSKQEQRLNCHLYQGRSLHALKHLNRQEHLAYDTSMMSTGQWYYWHCNHYSGPKTLTHSSPPSLNILFTYVNSLLDYGDTNCFLRNKVLHCWEKMCWAALHCSVVPCHEWWWGEIKRLDYTTKWTKMDGGDENTMGDLVLCIVPN